jgi:lysozyme family protein
MANYKNIIDHVAKWEGGPSSDPRDNALSLGHSGILGKDAGIKNYPNNFVHTSKGVIWATYLHYCRINKRKPNAQEFVKMPKPIWEGIVKNVFWDSIYLDKLKSQAIAEFLFDMLWGSGVGGIKSQVRDLQKLLIENKIDLGKAGADGVIGKATIDGLNEFVKNKTREKLVIDTLYKSRAQFLKTREDSGSYGKGWLNRLDELTASAYKQIEEQAKKPTTKIIAFGLLGLGGFFLYKSLLKK